MKFGLPVLTRLPAYGHGASECSTHGLYLDGAPDTCWHIRLCLRRRSIQWWWIGFKIRMRYRAKGLAREVKELYSLAKHKRCLSCKG